MRKKRVRPNLLKKNLTRKIHSFQKNFLTSFNSFAFLALFASGSSRRRLAKPAAAMKF